MASGSQKHGFDESRFEKDVSRNFICSVCLCVLKDPKMCKNEHVFCSDCITEHLHHSSTCPECVQPLTVETLKRPPRLLLNCLSELRLKCDHYSRGCRQYVQLEELSSHATNCDFAPVLCSNQDCGMEINKRDRVYHETHVCEYRYKCHECTEIRREMDEMKINTAEVKRDVTELKTDMTELKTDMSELKTDMAELKIEMAESRAKVNEDLTKVSMDLAEMKSSLADLLKAFRATTGEVLRNTNATHVKPAAELKNIIIVGGQKSYGASLSSVETFRWQTRSWAPLAPMKAPRYSATSFVYSDRIFVAGGYSDDGCTDSMEMMNFLDEAVQWETFPAKLPIKLGNYTTVVYQNRLIVVGGYDETHRKRSDAIYEVLLTPPYSTKLLRRMPEGRYSHGTQLINDKVFILGGWTGGGATDSVLMYDIARNKCKQMPSLPYAVWGMSTVSWRDKVILLGGLKKNFSSLSNEVMMYDTVTGETEVLPPMNHQRSGSSAVVTGDKVIVMAGNDGKDNLNSVECYSFSSNSWQKLPPMTDRRYGATAVVKPGNIYNR